MDRLTTRNSLGRAVLKNALLCERCNEAAWAPITEAGEDVADRLAAYEDAGLEPEEIGDMKTAYDENQVPYMIEATGSEAIHIHNFLLAEAQGRLIVLPCKVGDTVYVVRRCKDGSGFYVPAKVSGVHITAKVTRNSNDKESHYIVVRTDCGFAQHYDVRRIGKTVFLTRKEAEAELARRKGGC